MRGTRLSVSDDAFLVLAKPQRLNQPRLGLAIAKKYAKLAVQRNTIKRIVRESFRQQASHLPSLDIVVLARHKTKDYDKKQLRECIETLWKQLAKRAKKSQATSSSS
jgi:ribonuclease P protein component